MDKVIRNKRGLELVTSPPSGHETSSEKSSRVINPVNAKIFKSSHQRYSLKKAVLRNFANSTGKHMCQSLFFNKVAGLRPGTLLKKRLT